MRELIERVNEISAGWAEVMFAVAWQSAALALAIGVVCWALRWQSPGLRYWLWLALAAKLLVLPLWSVDVAGPAWWGELGGGEARVESLGAASMVDESTMPRGGVERPGDGEAVEQHVEAPLVGPAWYRSATWATWLCAVWVAVVAFEVGRTGWQFAGLRRLLAGSCAAEPSVEIVVEQCAARLGLARLPAVRVVKGAGSPMVCGLRRATLVLPAALAGAPLPRGERLGEGFSEPQLGSEREGMESSGIPPLAPPFEGGEENALRQIVLHELAHLQRRDLLTVWVIHLMRTVYWFNPVAHWVAYRAGLERELACDRLAMVNSGVSAAAYAHTLIDAAGGRAQPLVLNAAVAARLTG